MCYLGYNSRARAWQRRKGKMKDSAGHRYMAQAYAKEWSDMAAHAKKTFNALYPDVIPASLKSHK